MLNHATPQRRAKTMQSKTEIFHSQTQSHNWKSMSGIQEVVGPDRFWFGPSGLLVAEGTLLAGDLQADTGKGIY